MLYVVVLAVLLVALVVISTAPAEVVRVRIPLDPDISRQKKS